jgi:hypothetical protein
MRASHLSLFCALALSPTPTPIPAKVDYLALNDTSSPWFPDLQMQL